jgi:2-polyprenyl-3-methyl-5-hydroxy-6-metoxy-1,4-benzoquinol methylase
MNQIEHPLDGRLSQRHYYDEACDPEFEITRPHGCGRLYQFLISHKFQTGLAVLGVELAGKTVLEVCCGSGMLAEELARRSSGSFGPCLGAPTFCSVSGGTSWRWRE